MGKPPPDHRRLTRTPYDGNTPVAWPLDSD